jgi:hypothetical protein
MRPPALKIVGAVAVVAPLLFYIIVEGRWFRRELDQSVARSIADALIGVVVSLAITIGLGVLFY